MRIYGLQAIHLVLRGAILAKTISNRKTPQNYQMNILIWTLHLHLFEDLHHALPTFRCETAAQIFNLSNLPQLMRMQKMNV